MLRAQVLDAELAAPHRRVLVANAGAERERVSARLSRRTLDAARMQQPAHLAVIWVLHTGRVQLLGRDERPLRRVALDVEQGMDLVLRAEAKCILCLQKVAFRAASTGALLLILFLLAWASFAFMAIEVLLPRGAASDIVSQYLEMPKGIRGYFFRFNMLKSIHMDFCSPDHQGNA